MNVRNLAISIPLVTLGLLGGLCSAASANTAGAGQTFAIGIGSSLDTTDPARQTTTTVMNVLDYELQSLVTFDEKGNVEPLLAKSWSYSDDGKTLTFKLRDNVKFQDGTPFNAKAVKFSLERLLSDKVTVPFGQRFSSIKSIDIVGPHTVSVNLKYSDADILRNLGFTAAAIVAPSSLDVNGNSYENIKHPVGTGAYEMTSRTRGSKVTFTRYKNYWGKKPYYKSVVFRIIPEGSAREAALRSGQLQMIMNPPVSDLRALSASGRISVLKAPSDRSIYIAFNTLNAPFDNKKVRRAFNYAVDKEAIIKNVMFGAVNRMDSAFPKPLGGHCTVGGYDYNPGKAKKLLKQSGVGKISVTLGSPSGRYVNDIQASQAIANYLRQVGISVKVKTMGWPSYLEASHSKNGPLDLHMLGWAPSGVNAASQMEMFTKASWPPNGLNGSFYSNNKVKGLFEKAKHETDKSKRDNLYCKIQKIVWNDAPWLFLWSQNLLIAYDSDITGITYQPNEKFDTLYAHPKQE